MKAGLLICDHVDVEYQADFGDYPEMFARFLPDVEWVLYDVCQEEFPTNLEECDFYMATGSRHSVYENLPWIIQLKQLIKNIYEAKKCFIGFCFGHQLIGEALGGRVEKSTNGWCVGVHDFELIEERSWMQPSANSFGVLMMCQDQILELPDNTRVLAKSKMCPVGVIQVGETMLGIQGHPEFSKAYDQLLMEKRVDRMGKTVVEQGLESLTKTVNTDLLRKWCLQFISQNLIKKNIKC